MSSGNAVSDRLDFLQIDAATREILGEFMPTLTRELPGILAAFFRHLQQHPNLASMFQGQAAMDRAGQAQSQHWMKLFSGKFDDDYAASVRRVGLMHSRIGLEPRWYLGGYSFILGQLYTLASREFRSRFAPSAAQQKTGRLMAALNRVVMLDMDLAISIYLDENKAVFDRKLASLAATFEARIGPLVEGLATRAAALTATATAMSSTADDATHRSSSVAAAAEQASVNVQTVASATEELHASVAEISRQVGQSTQVTATAVRAAESTNVAVQELSGAAQKIGDVVALISNIANQTNLLALNATIEAARAGDAGKGFAVVASEVKGLAGQTAKATESITAQVSAMQTATQEAVKAIRGIVGTIATISEIATMIASAVEEQGAATQEIARNVQELARATQHVSSNISGVSQAVGDTSSAVGEILSSARDLGTQAGTLRADMGNFLREVRAA